MSSKFSLLTSAMPTFTKNTTLEAKVDALADYQVQLLEYLRYSMSNLDADNFNPSGLNEILKPVVAEISNTEGDILSLWMTADELAAQIEDADGNYSSLKATVDGVQSTVKAHTTTINNHTNSINSHGSSIASLQSQITQTANEIAAVVSAVDDDSGNVTAASIVAAINNAGSTVKISADHVDISGFVTFSDLSTPGATTISGANIETGTINADAIYGGTLSGVRFESYGYPSWADPLSGAQTVTIEDGGISISGVNLGRTFAGGFTIELTDGAKYEFTPGGIYLDGSRIA